MWLKLVLIGGAGVVGALSRWSLGGLIQESTQSVFPWGTLVVNVVGCALFGFVFSLTEGGTDFHRHARLVLLTGFAGAFTTFSTFAFETVQMVRLGQHGAATVNVLASNLLGCAAAALGMWLGRQV